MSDLFFNKNRFIKNEPARLAKPLVNDPSKLGRKTVEEIRKDMEKLNRPSNNSTLESENKDIQINQNSKLDSLNAFKMWNRK